MGKDRELKQLRQRRSFVNDGKLLENGLKMEKIKR